MAKKTKKRVKKAKKKTETQTYFVGISNPSELRKNLLEPTREVIQFLQSYEDFLKTKEEKTKFIFQLKDDLKAIKTEINKLKRFLPKSKLKAEIHKKIEEEIKREKRKTFKRTISPKPSLPKKPTELETLEKELSAIEEKLGTLSE